MTKPKCHYCNETLTFVEKLVSWVFGTCPNCHQDTNFHSSCFKDRHLNHPRCCGEYVGHPSGHTINVNDRFHCAHCGLAREFWNLWHCAKGVVELNRRQLEQRRALLVAEQHPQERSWVN